jgi:hypothetical protein
VVLVVVLVCVVVVGELGFPDVVFGFGTDIPTCDRALEIGACMDAGNDPVAVAAPPPITAAATIPDATFALSNLADNFPIIVFLPIVFLPSRAISLPVWMPGIA